MSRKQLLCLATTLLFLAVTLGAGPAAAQAHFKRVSGFVGFGGSGDGEPENGLDHSSLQLGLAFAAEKDLMVGVRLGRLDIGGEGFGLRKSPDLTYVSASGEYLFNEGYFTSGVFLGLGWYQLSDGGSGLGSETSAGVNLGLTAEFAVNRRVSILVEFSAHYADLEGIDVFAFVHTGIGYRF